MLLDSSNINEHSLFHFVIYPDMHSFVIEKFFDDCQSKYRIYQSWQNQFNLMEWIGVKPWRLAKSGFDDESKKIDSFYQMLNEQFQLYGQAKILTQEEIKKFLGLTFSFCANHDGVRWYCRPNEMGFIDVYNVKSVAELKEECAKFRRPSELEETHIDSFNSCSPRLFQRSHINDRKSFEPKNNLTIERALDQCKADGSISNNLNINFTP